MSEPNKLNRAVAATALLLLAAIAIVLWRGDRVGIAILGSAPAPGALAAASAPVVIEFGQRMNAASVQAHFSIEPPVAGSFFWNENTMYFLPEQPLEIGQRYTVQLAQGAKGQVGHDLLEDLTFSFEVRLPGIAFLREAAVSGYELWSLPDLEEEPIQIFDDAVFDFAVGEDGNQLIFSVMNDQNGIDLWIAGRSGGDARILLECGADRCFAPAPSRSGRIAYSRASAPLTPAEPYSPPRIWLLDPRSGETVRLHADTQKIGYGPSWSPDGRRLAYYDGIGSRIVIVDILNGQETHLPTRAGTTGTWSPDGAQMLFYDTESGPGGIINKIYRAQLDEQDVLPFFDPQPTDADYSAPVLSLDGQWVALKMRSQEGGFSEQIWVLPPDASYAIVAVPEPDFLYGSYAWGPDSASLLFHRIRLASAERQPQAWLWQRETGAARLLMDNASQPRWLP